MTDALLASRGLMLLRARFVCAAALATLLHGVAGAEPYLVRDINPGRDSVPTDFTPANGKLFFRACDQSYHDRENDRYRPSHCRLWESDGTADGTIPVPRAPSALGSMTGFGGATVFQVIDGGAASMSALWRTDGTADGTTELADFAPVPFSYLPHFTVVNDLLFFQACEPSDGCTVWKTDGTPAGTTRLFDATPAPFTLESDIFESPRYFARKGLFFFTAC